MKDMVVSAKVSENKKEGTPEMSGQITVKAPETIKEAREAYGDEAILSNAIANWKVTLQGNIRAALRKGEDPAAMQVRLGGAKMGVATTAAQVDPKQAWLAQYAAATPEERKKMKQDLLKQAEAIA